MIPILERLDEQERLHMIADGHAVDELLDAYPTLHAIIIEAVEVLEEVSTPECVPRGSQACCRAYTALERIKELGA